jgi:hypothetical protein
MKKTTAASEVDAYCTKCRMDLNHRIVAMKGERIARVECLTCRGQHNYRAPKSAASTGTTRRRAASSTKKAGARRTTRVSIEEQNRQLWESAIVGKSPGDFVSYNIKQVFAQGQLVRHKKFGDGIVNALMEDGKVTVLFQDGEKVLVHGR